MCLYCLAEDVLLFLLREVLFDILFKRIISRSFTWNFVFIIFHFSAKIVFVTGNNVQNIIKINS